MTLHSGSSSTGAGRLLISIYCLFTRPRLLIHTFQLLCNTLQRTTGAFEWIVVGCLLMFSNAEAKSGSVSQRQEGNGWASRSHAFSPTFFRNEDENRIVNAMIHSHLWGILNEVTKRTTLLHLNIKESRSTSGTWLFEKYILNNNNKNIIYFM